MAGQIEASGQNELSKQTAVDVQAQGALAPRGSGGVPAENWWEDINVYDFELPRRLIAQEPMPNREDARLMVVRRRRGTIAHHRVRDLPKILRPGDCLVFNDSKVIPARLVGFRTATGGRWQGLFLREEPGGFWRVLGKTRGKLRYGETLTLLDLEGREDVRLSVGVRDVDGTWIVRPESNEPVEKILERVGRVPIPPYIRDGQMIESDRERYQTVYARRPGSVAAPTAGLHFTHRLLAELRETGIELCWVTLHIGLGTFKPIESQHISQHKMHAEWGEIDEVTVEKILACRQRGGRVVAVGSTSLRILETAAREGELKPFRGETNLFIRPPFEFKIADGLFTNFHLPRSTLLVLVYTFGGFELMRRAYQEAIREEYRFYSYGDAMLIL
ncbi:MAG: tRNA preQ1(34) S-adenosylmethionine ribosyltransferase-isomerase QueA [Thermoguttaceae bacterium]|nr:tRNA preQ1(34) S-adenosylmethionine ribosyltransferase-isomerase QueA [Thermoguttaceae bacterium]MDW8078922.1 tRNA preQ1(34) S-adenosylmethionine ribosyltransferase-isomerase QueA [Thermoguttaceae bacterium]